MDEPRPSLLSCTCPGCRSATAVTSLAASTSLTCVACGRTFTLPEALQPPPGSAAETSGPPMPASDRRSRRSHRAIAIAVLAAGLTALVWAMLPGTEAERDALRAFCAPLASSDAGYPRAGLTIRNRAWVAGCPSQPDGVALFTRLPAARFGGTTAIDGGRLREVLAPLRGHAWIPSLSVWVEGARSDEVKRDAGLSLGALAARGIGHLTVTELGRRLGDGLGDALAAQAILDLLAGTPGTDAQALGRRMLVEGEFPDRIILRPFDGTEGTRLIDQGRPPYVTATSGYEGLLLRCVGVGWPGGYRLLALRAEKG